MPVRKEFTSDISDQQESEANKAFDKLTKSGLFNDLLTDADATITFTNKVTPGTKGSYIPSSGLLRIQPSGSADEILNTIAHELTHAAQTRAAKLGYLAGDNSDRRQMSPELLKAADAAGVNYDKGGLELEAWTAANLRPGVTYKDPQMTELLKKFPDQMQELYRNTVQPMREPVKHTKGYPEMNPVEKTLNTLFGYQPSTK